MNETAIAALSGPSAQVANCPLFYLTAAEPEIPVLSVGEAHSWPSPTMFRWVMFGGYRRHWDGLTLCPGYRPADPAQMLRAVLRLGLE